MDSARRTTWLRRLRRALRVAGVAAASLVAVILVVVLAVLLLPTSRRALLDKGLELAADALPGDLTVANADWPGLGRLELDGVIWTDGPDTLARVDTLRVQVDISELWRRDVTVRRLLAAGIAADVPAIVARFPATSPDTTAVAEPAEPGVFPRAGAVPPLPSLAVERLAIRRVAVTTAPDQVVRLDSLTAAVDLRHDRTPRLAVALRGQPIPDLGIAWRFTGSGDGDTLAFDLAPLSVDTTDELPDPSTLPLTGRLALPVAMLDSLLAGQVPRWPSLELSQLAIAGEPGDWRLDAHLDGRRPGHLLLESTLPEAPRALLTALRSASADTLAPGLLDSLAAHWGRQGDPGLRLRVDLEPPPAPGPLLATRLVIDGDLRLPALSTLAPLLPPQLVVDDLGPILAALDLSYDGQTQPPAFAARVDLGATEWIDAAIVAASGDTNVARLDSLVVRLSGVALTGAGAVDRDSLRVTLDLTVSDGSLLDRWRDQVLGDLDPRAIIRVDAVSVWPLPALVLPDTLDATDPLASIPSLPGRIDFQGDLHLPPPSALGPLLPPQLVVDDLGPIHAALDLQYDGLAGVPRFAATLDLSDTDWLDACQLAVDGNTDAVNLDSLVVRLPGLSLDARGDADRQSARLALHLDLPDSTLLQRWNDPALVGIRPRARVSLAADGTWPLPPLDLDADLALVTPRVTIPDVSVKATATTDTLVLDVDLPAGLSTPNQVLTSASFRFNGAAADSLRWLRGAFRTDVRAPRSGILLAGRVDARNVLDAPSGTVTGDTLSLDLGGRGLTNHEPWRIAFAAADSLVEVVDLRLSGDLGRFELAGRATPDSLRASLALALELAMDALATILPTNLREYLPAGTVTLTGDLAAAGEPATPWASGQLRVAIADNPDLAGIGIETHLTVGRAGAPPEGIEPGRAGWRPHSARADITLSDAGSDLARVTALVPLDHPGATTDSVEVRLDASNLDLARLDPLLPRGTKLSGRLDADTRVAGLMAPGQQDPDPELSGGLRLTGMRLASPDGSWMSMAGNVDLEGTALSPTVRGGLDISGGLIRVPEPPPSLLPDRGEALLWQTKTLAADSLAAAAVDTVGDQPELPSFLPDLTFAVRCPGSLWLRGQGLDVELSGDLALHLREGRPAIEGELKALQGTMKTLGRVFNLDRGRIIFYADEDELNPELDLALGVRVGSYQVTITLTGTANEPKLEFNSSPDLADGDIISVLLFGKTSDELDEGQSGLMAERAAQVALAYGSVKLQESLARGLGVDVLSIAPQSGDSDKSALTVGKYLSPKVMVRYEQVLDEESAFYVHLDYNLTSKQEWKLHTQISQGEASGVEIKWEKEW